MGMHSLQKLYKLWKKVDKRHFPERKTIKPAKIKDQKEKKVHTQWSKIDRGLRVLRKAAQGGLKSEAKKEQFTGVRTKVLLVLSKYCVLLKPILKKMEFGKEHIKYLKSVKQLAVVLLAIDPDQVPVTEDPNAPAELSLIENVDTTEYDTNLESGSVAETDDIDFEDVGDDEDSDNVQPNENDSQNSDNENTNEEPSGAKDWEKLLVAAKQTLATAESNNNPDVAKMKVVLIAAESSANKGQYNQAKVRLKQIYALAKMATQVEPTGIELWFKHRGEAVRGIIDLQTALAKSGAPKAKIIVGRLQKIRLGLQLSPDSPENIKKLQAALSNQDIALAEKSNPWGVSVNIRKPLQDALNALKN